MAPTVSQRSDPPPSAAASRADASPRSDAAPPSPDGAVHPGALVLVVEDEPVLAQTLELFLRSAGYHTERAADGRRALELYRASAPDLVVLDLGLPEIGGTDVLRAIRRRDATPVLVLTARSEEIDEILGLQLGADDYLAKPVSARRFMAHVEALLRRSGAADAPQRAHAPLRVGDLEVDPWAVQASYAGQPLELTPAEYRLLEHFARTPGRAIERAELLEVAVPEGQALERAVDLHITNLRRKLRPHGADATIETVRGVGYRLAAP